MAPPKRKFKWRRWNNILHRDIGYLAVGLTVVYAISGVAVNHRADWNPSYTFENFLEGDSNRLGRTPLAKLGFLKRITVSI